MFSIVNDQIANAVYSFELLPLLKEIEFDIFAQRNEMAFNKLHILRQHLKQVELDYLNSIETKHQQSSINWDNIPF